ncbi:hypothetical protein [Marinomonas transparens]|uniref:Uncharacterized protein n=1 Tax=Marinomonas transparens TaxID=2795388 RepID=A0A934JWL6_9GAMM|nr:hypothetical protein [Marinomonas transparens]MBJ7538332.1 hypothetical protein [Marinomonas transparens]
MYEDASNSNLIMLLHTAIYPLLVALIISFIAGKLLRTSSYLGYLGGFLVGLSLIHSGLSFPPKQAIDYYTVTALIGIASLLTLSLIANQTIRSGISFILFGLSFYLLLNPVLKHSGLITTLSWSIVCALILLGYSLLSEKAQTSAQIQIKQKQGLSALLFPIGLMIVAGSAAPVISIGGSLLIGQLLGAFGAAVFGYVIIAFLTKNVQSYNSIPALLLLGGLITQSHVLADTPISIMLLLTASCFVTPIVSILSSKAKESRRNAIVIISQIIISSVISGLGLWLVWPESSLY